MVSKNIQDQLSLLIIRSSMKAKYSIVDIAEDNKITLMQAMTLCLMEPKRSVPMKSFASFLSCDPSNITGIIEQLVHEGLVDRKESARDRRIKTVTITAKGLKLRDKLLEVTRNARLPMLNELSEAETKQLITILEKATNINAQQGLTALGKEGQPQKP